MLKEGEEEGRLFTGSRCGGVQDAYQSRQLVVPSILISHRVGVFAQEGDNHILPTFYHAVGLGMAHAGRGVLNVELGT